MNLCSAEAPHLFQSHRYHWHAIEYLCWKNWNNETLHDFYLSPSLFPLVCFLFYIFVTVFFFAFNFKQRHRLIIENEKKPCCWVYSIEDKKNVHTIQWHNAIQRWKEDDALTSTQQSNAMYNWCEYREKKKVNTTERMRGQTK